jgi:geranylgeranyl pyrophosphate synthase
LRENSGHIDRELKNFFPKKTSRARLNQFLGKAEYSYDEKTIIREVSFPIWDFLSRGGKRWRPYLMLLSCRAVGGNPEKLKKFSVFPELIHNGTIMVDDVEDDSPMRRGKPSTHRAFGIDTAINDGNLLYFLPLELLYNNSLRLPEKKLISIYNLYAQEMLRLSFGQALDIHWRKSKLAVSEKEYLQMCVYKTGTLARLSAKLGAILGGASASQADALGRFAASLGVAFQIQDDILNLKPGKGWGKKLGEDITEGKRTLLVIHTLKNSGRKPAKRLEKILSMHTSDRKKIREAISIIESSGSIDYASKFARKIVECSWKKLSPKLKKSDAKQKLKEFADFAVNRKI